MESEKHIDAVLTGVCVCVCSEDLTSQHKSDHKTKPKVRL